LARAKARAHAVINRPIPLRSRRVGRPSKTASGGALGPRAEELTVLGYHTGADPHPERLASCSAARMQGAASSRRSWRRLRAEDHDVYPEEVGAMGGDAAGAARSNGRGPPGELFATTQERGQIHDAELAVTKDGKILGVRTSSCTTPAPTSYGLTVPINSQCTLLGPYDIPSYESEFTAGLHDKTIVTPVRAQGASTACS